jgi:tRNA A-37 threonylcarbamoyl transferase component Bud32
MEKIIASGAEAILIQEKDKLVKRRISKGYRLPVLDEKLRKLRTRSEAKIIQKLQDKINVPKIIKVDEHSKEIEMEFIQGKKLSEHLDNFDLNKQEEICSQIGLEVSKMHDLDIVHGDLTTSNMILVEVTGKNNACNYSPNISNSHFNNQSARVGEQLHFTKINKDKKMGLRAGWEDNNSKFKSYLIDFGLGFQNAKIEDKAVDIHLFKQALESKHFKHWEKLFHAFLHGYSSQDKTKIINQLEKVESRGRYKH